MNKRLDIAAGIFKIDLLENYVEAENRCKVEGKKAEKEMTEKESFYFKALKSRLVILENKAVITN